MPYIPGTGRLTDVYHSGNVYINNVPVALWLNAGASGSFGGVAVDVAVTLPEETVIALSAETNNYVAAQTGQPNQYYSAAAAGDGVKGNYAGTPDDGTTSTGTVAADAQFNDIVPFLTKCLDEAAQGKWRETGQGGKPSNPTITGMWQNLGYSGSPWNTDQTAWCMGFVNFALKSAGYKYVQTASAAAITTSPARWNAVQVPKDQAQPGDIAFWSYRHVNFVYTAQNGKYVFVGGNQTPSGGKNNPDDGDLTKSYPGGTPASNANWVSCWRPSKT